MGRGGVGRGRRPRDEFDDNNAPHMRGLCRCHLHNMSSCYETKFNYCFVRRYGAQ